MKEKYSLKYFQKLKTLPKHIAYPLAVYLKKEKVKNVLEVGCGSGEMLKFLKKRGFKTIGVDQSAIAVRLSGGLRAKATNLPFEKNSFEAVIGISLIEHLNLDESKKFLEEAYRVLKKGGLIFLITPNLWSPAKFLSGKKWSAYRDQTHQHFYSPFSLAKHCRQAGFSQIKFFFQTPSKTPFDWPIPKIFYRLPPFLKKIVNLMLITSPLALFRDSFWLSAKK